MPFYSLIKHSKWLLWPAALRLLSRGTLARPEEGKGHMQPGVSLHSTAVMTADQLTLGCPFAQG